MIAALGLTPILLAIIAFPRWSWSRRWGYTPAAGLFIAAALVLLMHLHDMI